MKKQEAVKVIDEKLQLAYKCLNEAAALADKHKIFFDLPWNGDLWGMGASYIPKSATEKELEEHYARWGEPGWQPSAGSC